MEPEVTPKETKDTIDVDILDATETSSEESEEMCLHLIILILAYLS